MDPDAVDVVELDALIHNDAVLGSIRVMEDHTVCIEEVTPLGQQVVGLGNPVVLSAFRQNVLDSLVVFLEVVIVHFAVILDHMDQAGIFHDLAVLDPVGIRAGVVQAALVAQEDAGFIVEDEGGLMAAVLRGGLVKTLDDVAVFIEVVAAAVNGGPGSVIRLHTFHKVGSANVIGEPAVPEPPLGIKGNVFLQIDRLPVVIGIARAVLFGVPAYEPVVFAGEEVRIQRAVHSVLHRLLIHAAFAAVCIKGHKNKGESGSKGSRVGSIAGNRADCRCPAVKGVGIPFISGLGGCCTVIGRQRVVGHIIIGFQSGTVVILPGDRVGLRLPLGIESGIHSQSGGKGLVVVRRTVSIRIGVPAGEDVALALEAVFGQCNFIALLHGLRSHFAAAAVCVKADSVEFPFRGVKLSGVLRRAGHNLDFRIPFAVEAVPIGIIHGLLRDLADILGPLVIRHKLLLQHGAVVILPGDGVGVDCGSVLCGVGHIAGNFGDLRRPALEGVGILRGGCLGGRIAVIAGRCAVGHILVRLQNRAVGILPGDGVGVGKLIKLCGIHGVAGDGRLVSQSNARGVFPTGEPVAELLIAGLGRRITCVTDHRAIAKLFGFDHRAVFVHPGNAVLSHSGCELGIIDSVSGDRGKNLKLFTRLVCPALEGEYRVDSAFLGGCSLVNRCCTILHFAFLQ